MTFIDMFGFIAAFLTSVSFLPQALMVIKTGKTESLSLLMYSMFTIGIALWLTYGIITTTLPLIFANIITLTLAGIILSIKLKNTLKHHIASRLPGS